MAKSNARRQAEYRARHRENGGERLNMAISLHAKRTLERLASCYGVTQQAMLERAVLDRLPSRGQDDYYDKRLRLKKPVTP